MSGTTPAQSLADTVMAAIRGGTAAQRVLQDIGGGCAPQDALFDALKVELLLNDDGRLRAWAREVQKRLEHGGGEAGAPA